MSTATIPVHVALVDETGQISIAELAKLAGAQNEQVHDEFFKDWKVLASVGAYPLEAVPNGCWTVRIRAQLDEPGALGFHTDVNRQPVSYVELTDSYTVTVSHETLEMLVDPWGNRVHQAALPEGIDPAQVGISNTDRVSYLIEVCDPCERASYAVGGVPLSDYMLDRWYRSAPGRNRWFSHLGTCTAPRQVADGGYVSFSTSNGNWWQVFNQAGQLSVRDLGPLTNDHRSIREFTDAKAREFRSSQQHA